MFDYDSESPLDLRRAGTRPLEGGIVHGVFSFLTPDLIRRAVHVFRPQDEGRPHPAILYVHWYESESGSSNLRQWFPEAEEMARAGAICYCVETLWSDRDWFLKRTQEEDYDASISQVIELRRALDLIEEEPGFDPTRLAYVGHDFGGMYGALMGAHDGRPTQYVLMAATPRWPDWYLYYPRLEGEARDAYIRLMAPLDPIAHVGKLAPAPLYFQFAADDFHVPKERAEEFFAAAGEPKEIGWYEAGHGLDDSARLDRAAWLKGQLGL